MSNLPKTITQLTLETAANLDISYIQNQDKTIHQLFEEQVTLYPDAVAVVFKDRQLTYRELNHRANQLAHYLQSLGVKPDVLVGICVERSLETIIGILGILKAGGAYVPLDPAYPSERIAYSLSDSQVPVLLTTEKHLDTLPVHQAKTVCLDGDWEVISENSTENPDSGVQPANLAYVIYTSGSTGKPKGVLIEHCNVVRLFSATQHWYHFNRHDVWTMFHSYAFDFSVWEIWGALFYGGKLVVVPYLVSRSPDTFYQLLVREGVTVLNQTPSAFIQLIQIEQSSNSYSELNLRYVIFGGEALELQSLKPWFDRHGDRIPQLVNMYGITETTVHVTYRPISLADLQNRSSVIGSPIPDLKIYLLDQSLQQVETGVVGEMYIEGAGLARGYLNREDLTQERFIANPFSKNSGSRLYKSGDLAKYLPNGDLEYLGRIDHQVKIRGFRIELGEIETVITAESTVSQTVAIVREDKPGNKRIVAYLVPIPHAVIDLTKMRQQLQDKLPDYMIPAAFVVLESIPLTPNGKVDKSALPIPETSALDLEDSYVAPRNELEGAIAEIWSEVLQLQPIGIDHNFFELGGDSLLATQVISRLRTALKIELAISTLWSAPTVAQLAIVIESEPNEDSHQLPAITHNSQLTEKPLSFAQQRLWFLDRIEENSATYNIPLALELTGTLDVKCLQQALNAIVQRHQVLRTSFIDVNGIPQQQILSSLTLELPLVDLSSLTPSDRDEQVKCLITQEAEQPFNLSQVPLIRTQLLKLSGIQHILLLNIHHIISDGWSMRIIMEELSAYYQGLQLEPLPIQYADFAIWQHQYINEEFFAPHLEYWQKQLTGIPPAIDLPSDRPRPPVQSYAGSSYSFKLTPELTEKLNAFSQRSGVTLYMTLLAAFGVLMHRYSHQEEVVIGSPIANRNRSEIESLIGFFVNTLVFRIDLAAQPSFSQLVQQVRQLALDAYTHQDVPFEKLVEVLQPERNLSYHPLFQVMFVLQNTGDRDLQLSDLVIQELEIPSVTAKFDLTLSMTETAGELRGTFEYKTALFDPTTIERMVGHWQTLLTAIATQPETPVTHLPLLTPREKHQLLVEWNQTQVDYPQDKCIHHLFEEQVEKCPDAVAVVFEDSQLTYQQLNQRANQLAHYLQDLGVGADILVGICVERSIEMVVGLLGILKAGGAYVPLDPKYPQERLSYMLEDSGIKVLLTQKSLQELLPQNSTKVICLDTDWQIVECQPKDNLDREIASDNLAYVIYTSGSTGKPKGVLIEHQGLCNLAQAHRNIFDVKPTSHVLQFASVSFDASVSEICMALTSGAMLVLGTASQLMPGDDLKQILVQCGITHVTLPPSALAVLPTDELPALGQIIVAGETCPSELVSQWSVGRRFFNAYGPTESTVCATVAEIHENTKEITIGRPIANTQIYILDSYLQPVPIGVIGELYIGGDGLARGYLNRPELTQQKFISNPLKNSDKLYKTGDLARYLPDSRIEFLGRIDHQVKIRGFRIELGEIEAVLNSHPQTQQAVVIALEDIPGNKRLVAYVVSSAPSLTISKLREFLKQKLPEYAIPSAFVILDTFPLTPNGKVDRKALPLPKGEISREHEYVAPRTPTEKIIANIFSLVLGVQKIGINDNFFELGGHSLLATQVISRLKIALQIELSIATFWSAPTIAQLVAMIESDRTKAHKQLPIITHNPQLTEKPLSFAQQRLWFLDRLEGENAAYNIPVGVRLTGKLDVSALDKAFQIIIARHATLRTIFKVVDGSPLQVVRPDVDIPLKIEDLQSLSPEIRELEVKRLIDREAKQPFNLCQDNLLRVSLLQLESEVHILLVTIHHIISDGWSIGILFQELSSLYTSFIHNNLLQLEPLSIQYTDFVDWQNKLLEGELDLQLSYWREQLRDAPPLLELPIDKPRPAIQTFNGASQIIKLSPSLSQELKTFSRQHNVTLFMTLLTAFKILLYRHTGQEDLIVGTPIASRTRPELERLIGFFINTVVLRTKLQGNPSFIDLLNRVREVALNAYANQDLPFEKLVEELRPQRDLSYSPIFQVWFNMINLQGLTLELPDLTTENITFPEPGSKFDLTLYIREKETTLELEWLYNPDLFTPATITALSDRFNTLLTEIVQDPEQSISKYDLIDKVERKRLDHLSNAIVPTQSFSEFPQAEIWQSIPERFVKQVALYPDNLAVVSDRYQWNYTTLNSHGNCIAQKILQQWADKSVKIALLLEHDAPAISAILGVLKAGKTYICLDPTYPQSRLEYILADSQATAIITNNQNQSLATQLTTENLTLINYDELDLTQNWQNPEIVISPDTLAYILYTSGSTGQPKGVMQIHRNVQHFIRNYTNNLHISSEDTLAWVASYSFDAAVIDIFSALLNGATLYAIDVKQQGLSGLRKSLESETITIYHSTPTLYRHFLDSLPSPSSNLFPKIRLVVLGGEEVVRQDVEKYKQYFSDNCIFVNGLGCSESSFHLQYLIDKQTPITQNRVPVGYRYDETEVLLLDEAGNDTEIYGEIAIRSPYLALGYWQQPELTAKVFLNDPDGGERRIYRTGDLGYLRPDGTLEYHGRKDFQVKIRGFRIELGEVEHEIALHPQIKETVVMAKSDATGNKILVAYLVGKSTASELKEYLRNRLPDYMIPQAFVFLDALPLTPNGKINRLALPAPETVLTSDRQYIAPTTNTEQELGDIWCKTLNLEQVSINDNFFEIGGHSLLALRLFAEIQSKFHLDLSINTLFKAPTIAELAGIIDKQEITQTNSHLVAIQPLGDKQPFFFVHGAAGGLMKFQKLAQHIGIDRPFYGFEAIGMDGKEAIPQTIEEMASCYVRELKAFQPHGPYLIGGLCFGGKVAYEMAQQLHAQGEEVAKLILFNTPNTGTLKRSPLISRLRNHLVNTLEKGPGFVVQKIQGKIKWIEHRKRKQVKQQKLKDAIQSALAQGRELSYRERHLPVAEAHLQASKTYITKPYLGKVILLQTEGDLQAPEGYTKDPKWGWGELARGGLEIHFIPGRHNAVLTDENIPIQAGVIKDCLDRS